MKKMVFVCYAMMLAAGSYAQSSFTDEGAVLASGSIGIGSSLYGGLPLEAMVEFSTGDNLSVGGQIGYASYSRSYNYGYWGYYETYKIRYSNLWIGPRASYHFADLLGLDSDQIDLYSGAFLGFNIASARYEDGESRESVSAPGIISYAVYAGGRYRVAENLAVMSELGLGATTFRLGITYQIK